MGRLAQAIVGGLLLLGIVLPVPAQSSKAKAVAPAAASALPKGNALAGKAKAEDERCIECHGHDGNANDIEDGVGNIGKFPRLASQHPGYIIKQFKEFRSGKRNNETMAVMSKTVSDADLADIAAYFASQKLLPGNSEGSNPLGRNLFLAGDAARGILPCAGCHSGAAQEASPETPRIAGQHRRYLQKQLIEWRAGERRNSPGDVMNVVTKGLSDAEIDALANYVSSLQ
jgi:cytochrome c553